MELVDLWACKSHRAVGSDSPFLSSLPLGASLLSDDSSPDTMSLSILCPITSSIDMMNRLHIQPPHHLTHLSTLPPARAGPEWRRQGAARRDRQSAALRGLEQGEEEEEEGEEEEDEEYEWMEGGGSGGFAALHRGGQREGRGHKFKDKRCVQVSMQMTHRFYRQASEMQSDSQGGFHVTEVRPGSPATCPDQDQPFGPAASAPAVADRDAVIKVAER
ncbi:unnamed protein product [Pleuronectes platessa]|uniref:Uncharacterized protein n=1 Tax=Pleuronectes platessa TaxID=8262 RepID=A0A9N7URI8_PLEPL|nr:unnamed protein product [Pleuronectes platessa]